MTVTGKINSAGANLLKALITQIEQLPKPWEQITAREQEVVIFRLREAVESNVRSLVQALASADFPRIPATVESVTFKDGVKAVLKLSKSEAGTHELAEATGGHALVVLASASEFLEGIERIQADADQAELPLAPPPDRWEQIAAALEQTQAEEQPSDDADQAEPPPVKSMGQQAHELLAKVHVHVAIEICEAWTEQECTVAAYWALEYAKDPENCRVARPHWLPIPEPKAAEVPTAEGALDGNDEQRAEGTAASDVETPVDSPAAGGELGDIRSSEDDSEEHDDDEEDEDEKPQEDAAA